MTTDLIGSRSLAPFHKSVFPYHESLSLAYALFLEPSFLQRSGKFRKKWSIPPFNKKSWKQHGIDSSQYIKTFTFFLKTLNYYMKDMTT